MATLQGEKGKEEDEKLMQREGKNRRTGKAETIGITSEHVGKKEKGERRNNVTREVPALARGKEERKEEKKTDRRKKGEQGWEGLQLILLNEATTVKGEERRGGGTEVADIFTEKGEKWTSSKRGTENRPSDR